MQFAQPARRDLHQSRRHGVALKFCESAMRTEPRPTGRPASDLQVRTHRVRHEGCLLCARSSARLPGTGALKIQRSFLEYCRRWMQERRSFWQEPLLRVIEPVGYEERAVLEKLPSLNTSMNSHPSGPRPWIECGTPPGKNQRSPSLTSEINFARLNQQL